MDVDGPERKNGRVTTTVLGPDRVDGPWGQLGPIKQKTSTDHPSGVTSSIPDAPRTPRPPRGVPSRYQTGVQPSH